MRPAVTLLTAIVLGTALAACSGSEEKITYIEPPDVPSSLRAFRPNVHSLLVSNTGARDFTEEASLWVRGGSVFFDLGLWIGARVGGVVRVSATSYFGSEFRPLVLPGGTRALVYILRKGEGAGDEDYDTWPVTSGAPSDEAGAPRVTGDATAWTAYQDNDPTRHTIFDTPPLGAEVRQTVWGTAAVDSVLYQRFDVKNASADAWSDAYLGIWVDPDLGFAANDLVGCDVPLSMGYVYTAASPLETAWGAYQPACGIVLLETPQDAGFFAFPRVWKGDTEPENAAEAYNLLQGLNVNGEAFLDSTSGEPTRFTASGDPVAGTGSIEHVAADRRMMLVTGPLTFSPGDSATLVYAIVFARAAERLAAVTALRQAAGTLERGAGAR